MSDEPSSQQEPRLKLKLRPDKSLDGVPPVISTPPAAAQLPPPVIPSGPVAAAPAPSVAGMPAVIPPSLKLKSRITIKPSETGLSAEENPPATLPPPAGVAAPPPATPASLAEPKKLALPAIGAPPPVQANPAMVSSAGSRPGGAAVTVVGEAKPASGLPAKPPESEKPAAVDLPPPVMGRATDEKASPGARFKLKPIGPGAPPSPVATAASKQVAIPPPIPPPSKGPGNPPPASGAGRIVPVPSIPPPAAGMSARPKSAAAGKPMPRKPGRLGLMIGLVGVLVLIVTGYFWYGQYFAGAPKEPQHPVTVGKTPVPVHTAPAPGEAVQTPVEAGAASGAKPPAPSREMGPPPAPKKLPPPPPPDPSFEFRTFVDHLKGVVRYGPPTRLIINGLTFRPGDVVDPKLGVVFVGLDPETKELIFQDYTGATARRLF